MLTRLFETRSMTKRIEASASLRDVKYEIRGQLDDRAFAQKLLEEQHVLVAPGSSFNTPYSDHFRITTLPNPETIKPVFERIDSLLEQAA